MGDDCPGGHARGLAEQYEALGRELADWKRRAEDYRAEREDARNEWEHAKRERDVLRSALDAIWDYEESVQRDLKARGEVGDGTMQKLLRAKDLRSKC